MAGGCEGRPCAAGTLVTAKLAERQKAGPAIKPRGLEASAAGHPALPAPSLSGPPAGKVGTKQRRSPLERPEAQRAERRPRGPGTLGFCLGLPYFSSREVPPLTPLSPH